MTTGQANLDTDLKDLPKPKLDTCVPPAILTPSQIESIRQDLKESLACMDKYFEEMVAEMTEEEKKQIAHLL